MKTRIKNSFNYFLFALALAAVLFSGCSCSVKKPIPDPLAGWNFCFSQDPAKLDKAIADDCQDYIHKLNAEGYVGPIQLLEDGAGQHAARFEVFENNTSASWQYTLIYDKENKRIKTVKYGYRRHQS